MHERVTTLLATFAALALAEAQRADQMQDALGNRDVIGQAKGILMERHGVTADAAFGVLSRISQAENIKLAEIARRLVERRKEIIDRGLERLAALAAGLTGTDAQHWSDSLLTGMTGGQIISDDVVVACFHLRGGHIGTSPSPS
jgi:ANTAR domain